MAELFGKFLLPKTDFMNFNLVSTVRHQNDQYDTSSFKPRLSDQ